MRAAPPANESERLAALEQCKVLDTPPEAGFDAIAQLARELCGTRMAAVSLIDEKRQWFKAKVGIDDAETSRDQAFCAHALLESQPLVVEDTRRDPRFADNPAVLGEPNVRFYAGVPLRLADGAAVGTLCVFDTRPRVLSDAQLGSLRALARQVSIELQLRRALGSREPSSRAPPSGDEPLAIGQVLDARYRIERELGRGGMGVVYEARSVTDGSLVAIKTLLKRKQTPPAILARFVREARALGRLHGRHIARVLDAGDLRSGAPYMVVEHLQGRDLEQLVDMRGPLPVGEAVRYACEALEALEEAHALGIVHRDVKPSNLFIVQDDLRTCLKLLDFGIAKWLDVDVAVTAVTAITGHEMLGSPSYMSPEQMLSARDVDARTDLWSIGVCLYESLTETTPFGGDSMLACCASVLRDPPAPMRAWPEISPVLEAIIMRCLVKDRTARWQTARELREALLPFVGAE